jgi:hypothetical protein
MGVTYRFIADPSEPSEVLSWFRDLKIAPELVEKEHGVLLYFRESGPLQMQSHGTVDFKRSPVVSVVLPRVQRGVLWTVGEVHFGQHRYASSFQHYIKSVQLLPSGSLLMSVCSPPRVAAPTPIIWKDR